MESQQMMELLLKEIRAGQEETRTNQATLEASHKELLVKMDAETEAIRKETEAIRAETRVIEARTAAMRDKRLKANTSADARKNGGPPKET
jgi:hypothetical protein